MSNAFSRRTLLKGLGTVVALPWMESLVRAADTAAKTASSVPPKRAAFVYVPNGVHVPDWRPAKEGVLGNLPDILKPITPYKKYVNVLSELTLDKARANGDGGGDHARAMSSFLTGMQPRKTQGADIKIGMSADHHLARTIGKDSRFASLELGIEKGLNAGGCDSGYSCAYSANLSWRTESTPNAKECDPKAVFERLFGSGDSKEQQETRARREAYNLSILDFVNEDSKGLAKRLGKGDQLKLDEYFTSIREVEQRIVNLKKEREDNRARPKPNMEMPKSVAQGVEFNEHAKVMIDLMVVAFQTDLTRVITLPFANDGSGRSYKEIGVPEAHHELSHHQRNNEKQMKLKKINTHHMEMFAYMLEKMEKTKEQNGSNLLDNSFIVYGSGISDGDRHNHDELPILLAGLGGGTVTGGRHLVYPKETPLMNLYLAIFERMNAATKKFGDSTGVLKI